MKLISSEITRKVGKAVLKSKKNSPHIFFAAGVAGVIGSTVLACRATLKASKEIDEFREEVHDIKERASTQNETSMYENEGDYVKDMLHVYAKGAWTFGKLYILPVAVGSVGVACLVGSHVQLHRRNVALTSTLAGFMAMMEEYRERVREKFGEEVELDIYRGVQHEKVEGEKNPVPVVNVDGFSEYHRIFDPSNIHYEHSAEYNRIFIECQQNVLNTRLQAQGYLFLNDAYQALGFEKTRAGQIVGWVWPGKNGDGYVDFGLYEAYAQPFIMGKTRELFIDFNVDGPILHLINAEEI